MSKHTHTPGPWSVWADNNGRVKVGASTNCTVADLWHPPVGDAVCNARLIAAAPDMLAALRLFAEMAECTDHTDTRDGDVVMRLRHPTDSRYVELRRSDFRAVLAAIAKAEGGAQ